MTASQINANSLIAELRDQRTNTPATDFRLTGEQERRRHLKQFVEKHNLVDIDAAIEILQDEVVDLERTARQESETLHDLRMIRRGNV